MGEMGWGVWLEGGNVEEGPGGGLEREMEVSAVRRKWGKGDYLMLMMVGYPASLFFESLGAKKVKPPNTFFP